MGAFEQMSDSEAKPMKKAAFETCGETLQNFTFTVVTKRIPQRFFAKLVSLTEIFLNEFGWSWNIRNGMDVKRYFFLNVLGAQQD